MRAITFDGNIVSEAKNIADASTTSENTITISWLEIVPLVGLYDV